MNIAPKLMDRFRKNDMLTLRFDNGVVELPFVTTFGDVEPNQPLVFKDDYIRVEAAVNMGSFAKKYNVKRGDKCILAKAI